MIERKIIVPDGMLNASLQAACQRWGYKKEDWASVMQQHKETARLVLEAGLRWLSDNPIYLTDAGVHEIIVAIGDYSGSRHAHRMQFAELQRTLFLAPELKIPDGVEDLMWSESLYSGDLRFHEAIPDINKNIVEAFRRGQKAGQ